MSQHNQENDIKAKNGLIKTLTIERLLKRWNDRYSLENIYEIASQCCFGIYFKLPQERKIYLDIEKYLDELIGRKSNINSDRTHYIELKDKFYNFISAYPLLLEKKPGYVRLATPIEEEISSRCTTGSINHMIRGKKITPIKDNYNTFGFVKDGDSYIVESYFRNWQHPFVKEDVCVVFIEQIEQFEKQRGLNTCEKQVDIKNKPKQQREHALHSIIKDIYCSNKSLSAREIWQKLQDLANNDHDTIQEVTVWTSTPARSAKISWISPEGNERETKRRTFENFISKLKSKK